MSIGLPQILIILVLVLVVFGVGKLPRVMGDLGKGIKNFKEGLNEDDTDKDKDQDDGTTPDNLTDARKKDSEQSKTKV
ncbi:MAG: twin-arginine translocase TatA/TatE family subunit [Pseudomonadota bacterium]